VTAVVQAWRVVLHIGERGGEPIGNAGIIVAEPPTIAEASSRPAGAQRTQL
jgi:hypothetical protein